MPNSEIKPSSKAKLGRVLSEGDMETIQNDPAVIEVYLGA
ncbi:MAG: hypothetical protein IID61_18565 [SAR324 cluster bacterium]|nr:hypothetical protein [SAR324 cluster bacterium]